MTSINGPAPQGIKGFDKVFDAELLQVASRRERYGYGKSQIPDQRRTQPTPDHEQAEREHTGDHGPAENPAIPNIPAAAGTDSEPLPLRQTLNGLALSGGGIRSATFCLGLLQGLNDLNFLFPFDYLSTVSGGGFLGGWWSAWLARKRVGTRVEPRTVGLAALPEGVLLPSKMRSEEGNLTHFGVMSLKERDDLLNASNKVDFREAVRELFKKSSLFPPEERIEPKRSADYQSMGSSEAKEAMSDSSINAGVDPIHHLRLFGNYLTPRKGWLSADTWRAASVVSRNLVLTWLILLPVLIAFVLVGRLYFAAVNPDLPSSWSAVAAGGSTPTTQAVKSLEHNRDADNASSIRHLKHLLLFTAMPAMAATLCMIGCSGVWFYLVITESDEVVVVETSTANSITNNAPPNTQSRARGLMASLRQVQSSVGSSTSQIVRDPGRIGLTRFSLIIAVIVIAVIIYNAGSQLHRSLPNEGHHKVLISGIIWLVFFTLYAWFTACFAENECRWLGAGKTSEARRNWLIRRQSEIFAAAVVLSALLFICGPATQIFYLADVWWADYIQKIGWSAVVVSVAGAVFTAWKNAPAGGTDEKRKTENGLVVQIIMRVVPPMVLVVLLTLFACLGHNIVGRLSIRPDLRTTFQILLVGSSVVAVVFAIAEWKQREKNDGQKWLRVIEVSVAVLSIVLLIISLTVPGEILYDIPWAGQLFFNAFLFAFAVTWVMVFGCMADPNQITLHAFYQARLVRAYLGASNMERHGTDGTRHDFEVTEAVDNDDLPLGDISANCAAGGPYHLINTTLNLVAGRDLGTAQRHAANFIFSGLYCGSDRTGYQPTTGTQRDKSYMARRVTLGTAMAISGAAVSPNMGSVSMTSAEAMLLTLANVRLGFWAPTPNFGRWNQSQPRHWPFFMLREFLSNTNDQSSYCYLTDGGHFDNTGLYALVQRGCRNILLADCGADPSPACFADLGDAIRRCRIDFGAEISIGLTPLLSEKSAERYHFAAGTITYSESHVESLGWTGDIRSEKNRLGRIIVVKPSLITREPADVRQYGFQNKDFPQQTTAEQWFDEAQFESYRKLGMVSIDELLRKLTTDGEWIDGLEKATAFPTSLIDKLFAKASNP